MFSTHTWLVSIPATIMPPLPLAAWIAAYSASHDIPTGYTFGAVACLGPVPAPFRRHVDARQHAFCRFAVSQALAITYPCCFPATSRARNQHPVRQECQLQGESWHPWWHSWGHTPPLDSRACKTQSLPNPEGGSWQTLDGLWRDPPPPPHPGTARAAVPHGGGHGNARLPTTPVHTRPACPP